MAVAAPAEVNAAGDRGHRQVDPHRRAPGRGDESSCTACGTTSSPRPWRAPASSAYVGGLDRRVHRLSASVSARLPWFIGAVVILSFLLLMVVFRSVLVPLKAALMNLLSIGAAYGVVVAVFQWGWGASLFGVDETVPINPFVPMMMFAILFGLSMDYEVFLLSRIREEYLDAPATTHRRSSTDLAPPPGSSPRRR